jgi:prepilin peptidase CpaA
MQVLIFANLPSIVAVAVSAAAALLDYRTGRIPNWLTLPAICLGPTLSGLLGGRSDFVASLVGLVLAAAVPWLLYRSTQGRAIGGGDVKLFAALGALLGPTRGFEIQLAAFGILAMFALVALAYRGHLLRVVVNTIHLAANPLLPRKWRRPLETTSMTEFRMGPAIAAAVIANSTLACFHRFVPWLG